MKEIAYNLSQYYNDNLPINIMIGGVSYCDETYCIAREDSELNSFEYIYKGSGTVKIDGQIFTPKENDIYILKKHSKHRYWSSEENPWTKVWICFDGPLADNLMKSYISKDIFLVEACDISSEMSEIIELIHTNENYIGTVDRVTVILHKIFIAIKNRLSKNDSSFASHIEQYIAANINKKLTLEQICRHFAYSKNQIINVFKEKYNCTPYKYYINKRAAAIKQFLSDTNLPIKEIAQLMNFPDRYYFDNFFKSVYNVSPSDYRKRLRETKSIPR
ncbi:MAG: hypothetical protein A2Y17_01355 [Clostridiales bacterium GWF2_38_85]|nr:MAG: hypothetical protein A2Y17_01355 [Clostridiales bacterium GWF2_38_85]